jgi:SAM-dependent methyltransferase
MVDDAAWLDRMRRDWDDRAANDAEHYVFTQDSPGKLDFAQSGRDNYNQLVRPFLPLLLGGRPASKCRVLELGCGIGRMTRCFADQFAHVDAFDISPVMLAEARRRLDDFSNVVFHLGSGRDLNPVESASVDLVFSYIVLQHIPSREVIGNYILEAARVLRPGGAFKFQVNGAVAGEGSDTWAGAGFAGGQVDDMLRAAGLSRLAWEGLDTQYFVVTAFKGSSPLSDCVVLPGEPSSARHLRKGWGEIVDGSWRPIEPVSIAEIKRPSEAARFFAGIYFWPEDSGRVFQVSIDVDSESHVLTVTAAGDAYFEFDVKPGSGKATVTISIDPSPLRQPAARVLGIYQSRS